jgi:phenylacetic acid degradation operon negative regulatory protein
MVERALRPRSGSSAKALLLTVLGELVLPHGGTVWTRTVLEVLGLAGVAERNARQATARLAEQGILAGERRGRRTRWCLTADGRELLTTGTERIYSFGADGDDWDDHWLVVLCSVPEEQRAKRHQLRSRLEFEGFGFLAPGVAITPHLDREDVANAVLEDLELVPAAVVLRSEAGSLVSTTEMLHRAWDLDELAERYRTFTERFRRRAPTTDESQLAALVELVHEWRRFPFADPEIPARLLPRSWPGRRAKAVFDERHATWSPPAIRAYQAIESASTVPPTGG